MNAHEVIQRPRVTEKSVFVQSACNTYTFRVHPQANKVQIKEAVQELFKVKVKSVNTMNCRGKRRRTRMGIGFTNNWKKALVVLHEGEYIEGV